MGSKDWRSISDQEDASELESTSSVDEAALALVNALGSAAAGEALLRALICERTAEAQRADFWVQVYQRFSRRR